MRINPCLGQILDFSGRTRRKEFWPYFFVVGFLNVLLTRLAGQFTGAGPQDFDWRTDPILMLLHAGLLLAAGTRRLKDAGKSPWLNLFWLLPVLGPIVLMIFWCLNSTIGPNQYGPDPKAGEKGRGIDQVDLTANSGNPGPFITAQNQPPTLRGPGQHSPGPN